MLCAHNYLDRPQDIRANIQGSRGDICNSAVCWKADFNTRMDQIVQSFGPYAMLSIESFFLISFCPSPSSFTLTRGTPSHPVATGTRLTPVTSCLLFYHQGGRSRHNLRKSCLGKGVKQLQVSWKSRVSNI